MPDRNPYLILGVDFAASSDQARHAFAHAARRIRRRGGSWEIEDLNWALHEIEELESNPAELVSLYRVPADPSVFKPSGEGLFHPGPVPLPRRSARDDAEAMAAVREAAARELDELLLTACSALTTPPRSGYDERKGQG